VNAWPKIDDVVAALVVGDDRADPFDQRGAGGFNGNARQNRAGRVANNARDGACLLRQGGL